MVGFKAFSRSIIGISISIALLLLLICATICLLPPKNSQLTILCNLKGDIIKTDRCTISPEMKTLSKLASQQTSLDGFLKTLQVPQEKLKTWA